MTTHEKVDAVLVVMRSIGAEPKDGGFCGPRGRVITSIANGPVQMCVMLYQSLEGMTATYKVEFSMRFVSAQPHQIVESAQFLADKQASLWPFLPEETPAVYEALNERFGKR